MEEITLAKVLAIIKELSPLVEPTFEDVRWFVSYKLAEEMDDMSTKEIGRMLDGTKTGFETEDDVLGYLEYFDSEEDLREALVEFGYTPDLKKT